MFQFISLFWDFLDCRIFHLSLYSFIFIIAPRNKGLSQSEILILLNELDSEYYAGSDSDCEIDVDDSVNELIYEIGWLSEVLWRKVQTKSLKGKNDKKM